jgi:hypothetical protein
MQCSLSAFDFFNLAAAPFWFRGLNGTIIMAGHDRVMEAAMKAGFDALA